MIYALRSGRFSFFAGMSNYKDLPAPLQNPQYSFNFFNAKRYWKKSEAKFESNYLAGMHNHETEIESLFESIKKGRFSWYDFKEHFYYGVRYKHKRPT